mmetsp:Transcript_44634/g.103194  ORF Transcript_44634/g.103194 Transcript_44634/m.103194 type:complete len:169 (-) Transcript_44634:72-578(-)|eukprot:CAMPEP_0171090362 /NCGR_PEP_ID=MMETSP0766_2-20121228/30554_1 /TAXON_ID=439317 /ORGANISM="Gambierdiscus australes, Strain CAWD 149" /LENGTH=168 /DNA_ID=CAMNT_0011548343 /DNA_START=35 /DNA_END=541 /DNA_ORIENTATION=+
MICQRGAAFLLCAGACIVGGRLIVAHPAVGHWTMNNFVTKSSTFELTKKRWQDQLDGRAVSLDVAAGANNSFSLSIKVVNTLSTKVQVTQSAPGDATYPFDAVSIGLVKSTRMTGPPGSMEVERNVQTALKSVDRWLIDDGSLKLIGPSVELHFGTSRKPPVSKKQGN